MDTDYGRRCTAYRVGEQVRLRASEICVVVSCGEVQKWQRDTEVDKSEFGDKGEQSSKFEGPQRYYLKKSERIIDDTLAYPVRTN